MIWTCPRTTSTIDETNTELDLARDNNGKRVAVSAGRQISDVAAAAYRLCCKYKYLTRLYHFNVVAAADSSRRFCRRAPWSFDIFAIRAFFYIVWSTAHYACVGSFWNFLPSITFYAIRLLISSHLYIYCVRFVVFSRRVGISPMKKVNSRHVNWTSKIWRY